jgi:TP901 family phage tail tape measure protein
MEENRIPIKVDISANLKSSIDRAKESQKELQAGGHLTSVQNSRLTANMEQIDSLMAKWTKDGDLTFLEYESLRKNLVSFNRIIEKAAESLGGISPEIKKLTAQSIDLNSKTANLEKDAAYYNGRGQFKNNPNTNKEEYSFRDSFLNNLSKKSFSDEFGVDNGFIYKNRKTPTKDIARAYGLFYGLNKTEREKKAEDSFGDNSSKALETYNAIHKKEIEESGKAKASQTALEENTKKIEENTTALKAAESTSKNPTIIKAQENINTATTEVGNAEISSKNQSTNLADTKSHIEQTTTAIQKQQTALGRAFKQFTLYALVIRAAKSALQECISTITELDKSLTTQAMVTGITRQQAYSLIGSYSELAKQTGATTKEIAEAASEYLKQGHSIQDSLTLTKAAVSAAKVAGISVSDSINYLTTAVNGYRLSAEDAMSVSDKFAALAASSATDYDELAIAMSKVASQAKLAGMSMDYTLALLTKGLETTREAPETMGTALKTVIARMREISDYGETLSDGTDINNVEKQLAYVGIALKNDSGELRSTEDVLDELGKKWDNLNTNQQAAIAKALAGTRQQSRLIAMMDDYERVTELQEISVRSAGATAAQAAVYLTGIEAKLNSIKVT